MRSRATAAAETGTNTPKVALCEGNVKEKSAQHAVYFFSAIP